ncbi:hypothetical protein P167DRAFT_539862 [Morchella conica CCBAS932]|uniref:Uncharacterized protein n=1 Tax=Morchella conica CCBAS932 TaxID=1392247 RepID=A0A3N4KBA1_9PEZI|nr:hypothetical protein P167DRAFT_539862 [Morchella conica CCBAS932]
MYSQIYTCTVYVVFHKYSNIHIAPAATENNQKPDRWFAHLIMFHHSTPRYYLGSWLIVYYIIYWLGS